jgi:hypothetical protein
MPARNGQKTRARGAKAVTFALTDRFGYGSPSFIWATMVSIRLLLFVTGALVLQGCASHSSTAIANLDYQSNDFNTAGCQHARQNAWLHDELKSLRLLAGPSLLLIAGPVMAVPVIFANVGLNTVDHLKANDIKSSCGGKTLTGEQITQSIALDAGLTVLTGTVLNSAVTPGASSLISKP